MNIYRLPPVFYEDHRARDLPEQGVSRVVRVTARAVYVEMDDAAYADLLSDARYYSDLAAEMGLPGLASSARATIRALDRGAEPCLSHPDLAVDPYNERSTIMSERGDG